jgi:hypothetical protein
VDIADWNLELEKVKFKYKVRCAEIDAQRSKDLQGAATNNRVAVLTAFSVVGAALAGWLVPVQGAELVNPLAAMIIVVASVIRIIHLQDEEPQIKAVSKERLSQLEKDTEHHLKQLERVADFIADS